MAGGVRGRRSRRRKAVNYPVSGCSRLRYQCPENYVILDMGHLPCRGRSSVMQQAVATCAGASLRPWMPQDLGLWLQDAPLCTRSEPRSRDGADSARRGGVVSSVGGDARNGKEVRAASGRSAALGAERQQQTPDRASRGCRELRCKAPWGGRRTNRMRRQWGSYGCATTDRLEPSRRADTRSRARNDSGG